MFYSEKCGILLAGTQDVYLGDLKYGTDKCCWRLSKRRGYTQAVHRNFVFAQKHGDLLIRHLVLPNHLECCTAKCMEFVAQDLGTITRVNVMFQYRPEFNAYEIEDIARCLTTEECHRALQLAHAAGLTNLCRDV